MKDYTNKNPAFAETIRIMETTDTNHAENVNLTTRQLMDNTLVLKKQQDEFEETFGESEVYSPEEKEKLRLIEDGANKTVIDTELDEESENPVQNAVVAAELQALEQKVNNLTKMLPSALPTTGDAGKIIKIDADGQAVWAEDYGSSWKARYPEFLCDTDADISDKAHIVETDGFGYRKTTDRDGKNIIETLYGPDGEKIVQKQTVIDSELITGRLVDDEAQEQKE